MNFPTLTTPPRKGTIHGIFNILYKKQVRRTFWQRLNLTLELQDQDVKMQLANTHSYYKSIAVKVWKSGQAQLYSGAQVTG